MGEYARLRGSNDRIKIGTCEDLYYLRFDQLERIQPGVEDDPRRALESYRFRFPFPSEDDVEPGAFDDHDRGYRVDGVPTNDVEHHSVQFTARAGYVLSIPCPEQYGEDGLHAVTADWTVGDRDPVKVRVGRNGFNGGARVVQQRVWEGKLVTVLDCGSCGARWRLPTLEDALPVIGSILEHADRLEHAASIDPRRPQGTEPADWDSTVQRTREVALRIRRGYDLDVAAAVGVAV